MDNIRAAMKKSPAAIVLQTLRTALVLPQAAANAFIGEMTKPNEAQKAWIKKIDNSFWKGSLIAPNINCDSDAQAIRRLRKADLVIFEVHGGGFRVGSSTMYMPAFVSWITILKLKHGLDAVMMSVDYGLAPKHKYPEPVYDVLNAFKHLTEDLHVPGWKIIMSSDSAGSALTLETLIRTYAPGIIDDPEAPRSNHKVHLPAGMVLSSPLVTPEMNSWSWEHLEKHDMVSQHLAKLVFKEFLNYPHVNPDDLPILRLSGINHGYNRFAPKNALVFVGDKEVMRDDIMHLLDTVKADGWTKVRVCKEKYAHDWFLIREIVKKKDKMMLCQYDEVFADFAAYAVAEAAEQLSKDDNKQAEATTTKSAQAQVDVNLQAENIVETVNDILTADEKGAVVSHIENVDNNRPGLIVP